MILGAHLTLLIGPTVPLPAPFMITEALDSVEVTHSDHARSGFQLTFKIGRSGPLDLVDYPLLVNPLLRPFSRVILVVLLNATPHVLMDGFITRQQLSPGTEPGSSVTGRTRAARAPAPAARQRRVRVSGVRATTRALTGARRSHESCCGPTG